MIQLLEEFPGLQRLYVAGAEAVQLVCPSGDTASTGLALLKERMADETFELDCYDVKLVGTGAEIKNVLAILPPLDYPGGLALCFTETIGAQMDCLVQLPRVFPRVSSLNLDDSMAESGPFLTIDMKFFNPLAGFCELEHLILSAGIMFTKPGLLKLCDDLTYLTHLCYVACERSDGIPLVTRIQKPGRKDVVLSGLLSDDEVMIGHGDGGLASILSELHKLATKCKL